MEQTLFNTARPRTANQRMRVKPQTHPEWWPVTVGSVVLAVDPSIARCGWCLMLKTERDPVRLASGILYPRESADLSRFDALAENIFEIARRVVRFNGEEFRASDAIVEIPYGIGRGGRPMLDYARAVGICEAACRMAGLSMNRVRANHWKGSNGKQPTMLLVRHQFHYEPADENEGDAIGIASWLCWRR